MANNYMTPRWVADLQRSNRGVEQEFKTLEKTASEELSNHFNQFGEPNVEKVAVDSDMYDLMMTTKRLVQMQMSVSDGPAHDIASKVITKATEIQNQYGGNLDTIIKGIVGEMHTSAPAKDASPQLHVKALKQGARMKDLEAIEMRVMQEFGFSRQEMERYVRNLMTEASDLIVVYKGHDKYEMANYILDVIVSLGNPDLMYNIKSSNYAREQLEARLGVI